MKNTIIPRAGQQPLQLASAKYVMFVLLIILQFAVPASATDTGALPRSVPEREGVSSQGILRCLDAIERSGLEFHSLMIVRHGKVVTEGWWKPYSPELKHTMYSLSKSFTSTAIGFAVAEKRLSVDDKVISFFPADLPYSISPNLSALRVKDLLSMSVGQDPDPTMSTRRGDSNWVKLFLATPIVNTPGTKFLYNSLGSYMLSAIVQKVTGQRVLDYLTPRLFEPLKITGTDWEMDPRGINTGGWGLRIKTEDMAKFGQLYLQHGIWNGKQILSKEWIDQATTMKILQSPAMPQAQRDSSDWQQGYCYQFWRCRHNAFRGDGAFGQLIIVLPEDDAVVVATAEASDMQAELNVIWKYVLPALRTEPLQDAPNDAALLAAKLASLSLPHPAPGVPTTIAASPDGKLYSMGSNALHITSMKFGMDTTQCSVTINTETGEHLFSFGNGAWVEGTTTRRGPDLINARVKTIGIPTFRVEGWYRWTDERTLELTLRYIESPHTETIVCSFKENTVSVTFQNSLDRGKNKTVIEGEQKQ